MTRRQSNNHWSGSIAAHSVPKNSKCKNQLEKFSSRLFRIKTASSSLCSKGPNYQRGVLLISTGAIEGHFEGKMPHAESSPREPHSCTTVPRLTGTCNPEETGLPGLPVSWSHTYSPDLASLDYHLFPGLNKQLKGRHFLSGTEVAAAETWLDTTWFFLSGLQKLEQRTKRCIELRG
jgi:hypothetical protein